TTWVQIIKACLLLGGGTLVMLLAFSKFGFNFETLTTQAVANSKKGLALMGPGSLLADPVTAVSLSLGLMFGTAGLPHILMRFFTVPNAKEARKSVFVATLCVGFFFTVVALMGLSAITIVGTDPQYFEGSVVGSRLLGGNNMPAMHLAHAVGGNLLLGFLSAVAFATILAVVAGLALAGASAISHDLYANVIRKGQATEAEEVRISKSSSLILGVLAVLLGIAFERQNVAFMVGLAFGVAASCNFPVLILSMYWKGLTTRGAIWGSIAGLVSAVLIVVLSKAVWVSVLGNKEPIFPYEQPAIFSMPLAFFMAWLGSVTDSSVRATREKEAFEDQYVRAQTGFGSAGAAAH
ncbi:MAG TPA: cation acetate symporter, partial [Gammaproteobacteria bacterium]|nr:cation acetate symporter [Gammaproteobacteria bacterium]